MPAEDVAERPRRSVLYIPASNPRAIEKARSLPCDSVILDLEDSVAPDAKAAARTGAAAAIAAGFGGREVILRCNGADTPWGPDDLDMAVVAAPDGVLVPKARDAKDIETYAQRLAGSGARTRLWAMIETAEAVMNLDRLASASSRLAALVLGPNDLSVALRLRPAPDRAPLLPILSQMVVAARAHGLAALGGPFNAFGDALGFEAECRQDAAFGFDGKTLIHPAQIEAANRLFSPSPEDLAWARAVVEAFAAPETHDKGAIRLQGRMVERLHLDDARRTLALYGV